MYKYAEIFAGKVRDIRESSLGYVEFCSIFSPTSFWVDVTGVTDIGIGWIFKSNSIIGTYFEKPDVLDKVYSFEELKMDKSIHLTMAFDKVQENAYITSSLGFRVNAGQRAYRDIDGLITQMTEEGLDTIRFRDYDNIFQLISLSEAKTLKLEIIKNGQYIYAQKWQYENAIEKATTVEELDKIYIDFSMSDFFSNPYEETSE